MILSRRPRAAAFAGCVLVLLLLPGAAWSQTRIGLVPFENYSGVRVATEKVMPLVREALRERGYDVVPVGRFEITLREEKVRYFDSLPVRVVEKLASEHGVDAFLTGSILAYDTKGIPEIGLSARLVSRDGALLWGSTAGMTGDDFTKSFDRGTIRRMEDLAVIGIRRLFDTIGQGGVHFQERSLWLQRKPRFYRDREMGAEGREKVAILPFINRTVNRDAGRIVQNLLALRLAYQERFEVVELADVREALAAEKIRSIRTLGLPQMEALGKRLGARYLIQGTVYRFGGGRTRRGTVTPEAEINLVFWDAGKRKVVWNSDLDRKGADYLTVMEFGMIRDVVSLADQGLEEMVGTIRNTEEGEAGIRRGDIDSP